MTLRSWHKVVSRTGGVANIGKTVVATRVEGMAVVGVVEVAVVAVEAAVGTVAVEVAVVEEGAVQSHVLMASNLCPGTCLPVRWPVSLF